MKKTLYFFAALILLFSCKKEKINPSELRLTKTTGYDGQNGNTFKYDASGRIIAVINIKDNRTIASVSYNGNEVIIDRGFSTPGTVTREDVVKIFLDSEGKPLTRIQRVFMEYSSPNTLPQKDFLNDTLLYEYDAQGLLKRTIGRTFDSLWFNPNDLETQSHWTESTTDYTVSNGNLTASVLNKNVGGAQWFRGTQFKYIEYTEDKYFYEYSKQYSNKTDFSNTAILNELEVTPFVLNKNYKNIPDKITRSIVSKDKNGVIYNMYDSNSKFTLEFDSKGFLYGIKIDGSPVEEKKYLFYQ